MKIVIKSADIICIKRKVQLGVKRAGDNTPLVTCKKRQNWTKHEVLKAG